MHHDNGVFRPRSRHEELVELKHGAPVPALLRRLYITEGLTQEQVAQTLGVSRQAVVRWMAAYNIPTRDRRAVAA